MRLLGSSYNSLAKCEEENMYSADMPLCFQVIVDIVKPLCHGITMNVKWESIWNCFEGTNILIFARSVGYCPYSQIL